MMPQAGRRAALSYADGRDSDSSWGHAPKPPGARYARVALMEAAINMEEDLGPCESTPTDHFALR